MKFSCSVVFHTGSECRAPCSEARTPKKILRRLALLVILSAWPGASTTQAATAVAVAAWGDNTYGQTDVPLAAQSGVISIAAGNFHTVVLKSDGSVVAWGKVWNGSQYIPASVPEGLSGVTAIAAGGNHTVALKNNGSVVAWGWNRYGQTDVPVADQSGVTAIVAGEDHTVALKNDGTVVAWGLNTSGQVTGTPPRFLSKQFHNRKSCHAGRSDFDRSDGN